MQRLRITVEKKQYPVLIGRGLFRSGEEEIPRLIQADRGAIITNTRVADCHLTAAGNFFRQWIARLTEIVLLDGEEHKSLAAMERMYRGLAGSGLDRKSVLIALGGGVITDMVGFAASTYLRGISFCQVPTSLLAQVDSSVGGKTGVNLPEGKNLVGTFYQPDGVMIDLDFLETLPPREFRKGLSEMVKAGFLAGGDLFALLRDQARSIERWDGDRLEAAVFLSVDYKRQVVEQDEREKGLRAVLNYGHTVGHALEQVLGYGTLSHGEAVAIGMVGEAAIGVRMGLVDPVFAETQKRILQSLDLPVASSVPVSRRGFVQALWQDKKREAGQLKFALVEQAGRPRFGIPVDETLILEVLPEIAEVIEP